MRNRNGTLAQTIWDWTFGGLPNWLILPGFLEHWSRIVKADEYPVTPTSIPKGERIDILLGPSLLLEKEIILPVAAKPNLQRAIDLNMRQSLPGGGVELLWRYGAGKKDGSNLSVPVYLVKKSVLAELRDVVAYRDSKLRMVAVASDQSAMPFWDDLKQLDRPRRFWAAISTALLATLIAFVLWQQFTATALLSQQVQALKSQKAIAAQRAVKLRQQLDTENTNFAAISRDLKMFQSEFHRLPILIDLTKALADETWISELSVNRHDLWMSGFTSNDVTKILGQIQKLPWAERVNLDGPVSFDSYSRLNRFDLSTTLRKQPKAEP